MSTTHDGSADRGGRRAGRTVNVDMSPETARLRNELADLWEIYPIAQWSPAFLRALIALCELDIITGGINDQPAPVLQLVGRPRNGHRP